MEIIVILNNIRSSENVGSIFRTCDAVGVSKIILCGYTPAPLDRFGRENKKLTKASLGAEKFVEWEKVTNLGEIIAGLRNYSSSVPCAGRETEQSKFSVENYACKAGGHNSADFRIIAVEQDKKAIDYKNLKNSNLVTRIPNIAFVFGNEVEGLSPDDLKLCDKIIEIPMKGKKESLNVSVAVGVVLFNLNSIHY